jgi:transposase
MPERKIELIGPGFKIHSVTGHNPKIIEAEYVGPVCCPECNSTDLRTKDRIQRRLRHASMGRSQTWLHLVLRKYHCLGCGRYFRPRMPGILPYRRSTEQFRRQVCLDHRDGISQEQLRRNCKVGTATVERWFHDHLELKERMFSGRECPAVLGIDEHFFSKKNGYVTTFCDLKKHRVFELALGRSEKALEPFLKQLKGRERVRVVCIDLSSSYRAIVRKYFPNARIVSDRFHVVRTVLRHFLETWKQLDPEGRRNRGLLSLMRRRASRLRPDQKLRLDRYLDAHPATRILYEAKESLCALLNIKHRTKKQCQPLIKRLVDWIWKLRYCGFPAMETLAETLDSWSSEIACMWRFTKNNGITEGFHTKMEVIQRRAYGFKNFENYRLRVIVLCG